MTGFLYVLSAVTDNVHSRVISIEMGDGICQRVTFLIETISLRFSIVQGELDDLEDMFKTMRLM